MVNSIHAFDCTYLFMGDANLRADSDGSRLNLEKDRTTNPRASQTIPDWSPRGRDDWLSRLFAVNGENYPWITTDRARLSAIKWCTSERARGRKKGQYRQYILTCARFNIISVAAAGVVSSLPRVFEPITSHREISGRIVYRLFSPSMRRDCFRSAGRMPGHLQMRIFVHVNNT